MSTETLRDVAMDKRSRAAAGRHSSRRLLLVALAVFAALAVAGGIAWWWLAVRDWETTDDAFIDTHMVRVASQVAGRVVAVAAEDNADMEAGRVLLRIDPAPFQARLAQAAAVRTADDGRLAQARAQLTVSQANVAVAQADANAAEANAMNAERDYNRVRELARSHSAALSRQQLDTLQANAQSAEAALVSAQRKVEAARAAARLAESAIITAEGELAAARAQAEQARLDLSYTDVTALESGRVTERRVAPGDYVQPGETLMALVPKHVWVTANFKETQLATMRPGQEALIAVDAYGSKVFHGHVDSIQRGSGAAFALLPPENATGNFVKVVQRVPVKIVFDDPADTADPLGPGMSVVPSVRVR